MIRYEYVATHDDGRTIRGTVSSDNAQKAIQDLALQGLLVSEIREAANFNDPIPSNFSAVSATAPAMAAAAPVYSEAPAGPSIFDDVVPPAETARAETPEYQLRPNDVPPSDQRSYFATNIWGPVMGKVPLVDLQNFFRQFAAMQNAGVPIVTSLETLGRQNPNFKLRGIIAEMGLAAQEGKPATYAMQRYPEVFTPLMISLLRAGEEGGFFQSALLQLSEYIQVEIELRNSYRKATLYPKLVVGASIVIILAANSIIAAVGGKGFIESPLTTANVGIVAAATLVFLFLYFRIGLANPRVRYNWDLFLLKVPYLGATLHQFAMAKFGRAFGALHRAGMPVNRSVLLAADAIGNEWLRSQIYPVGKKLEEGDGLAGSLAETGAFSPIVLNMIQTGETSGEIDGMLTRASKFYEEEASLRSKQLATVTNVVCMVAVGIYVAIIVINFYTGFTAPLRDAAKDAAGFFMPF